MPVTLYKRQKEILDFISQYIQKHGTSPTLQEIADAMDLSSLATVHEHLETLEDKSVIKRYKGAVRGIEVIGGGIEESLEGIEVPLVGMIAAGEPIEAIEDPTETITISPSLVTGKKRSFVLQVKGDSMIEEGILDRDYVVVEQQDTAENGDIVVALLENGFATLKQFFKEEDRIRLEPANSSMDPIYATNVQIQGKVVGVIRRF
ncbi:MAG: transcriptional repressor LexA [Patescibacteria group bacterium]